MLCGDLERWDGGVGGMEGWVGGRSKREGTHTHTQLIHGVQQKLIQHCKVMILQLKKKKDGQSLVSAGIQNGMP